MIFTENGIFETQTCCLCGIQFGMPQHFLNKRRVDKEGFYCPNGHCLSFQKSKVQQLEEELARQKQYTESFRQDRDRQLENRKAAERSASAYKGVATRLKNRATNGNCPCCDQHFPDLAEHMKIHHPEFESEDEVAT